MAAMAGSVFVTVTLLMCIAGSQAMNLLRASGNPPAIPSVHCWCASYPNQTLCSWPEPHHSPRIRYDATFRERHGQPDPLPCQLIPPGSLSSALNTASSSSDRLWHCLLPDLKLLTDYIINITAVSPRGSSSYLRSFMLEEIVKPNPPINVRVSYNLKKGLLVEWSAPPTWSNLDIFPLLYEMQCQWTRKGSPESCTLHINTNTTKELNGLPLVQTYQCQVRARELLGLGEYSAWSSPASITIPKTILETSSPFSSF